jgi:hypothetical protein
MKKLFILLIAISFFSCNNQEKEIKSKNVVNKLEAKDSTRKVKNDWEKKHLFDKVQKIIELTSNNKHTFIFNRFGFIVEESEYDSNGNLFQRVVCKYDNNNYLMEEIIYDSFNTISTINKFKYQNNLLIEHCLLKPDETLERIDKYSYDKKGNKIEENWFDSQNNLILKFISKYDNIGNCTATQEFNSKNQLSTIYEYRLDDNGNSIENIWLDSNEKIRHRLVFKFDEYNNIIEQKTFGDNGSLKEIYKTKYEIDYHKNWIKNTFYMNGDIFNETARQITYFK